MDERVEILARVNAEHRTDRAWCYGYGEDMGYDKNTAGSVCRCGAAFIRTERDADPHGEWFDHWAVESVAALEAAGFYVGRLEQVGWWDEDGFWRKGTGGPVPLTVEPVFRKVVSDENSGCDKRCSEMHTYEPPCELAAPMPDAAGMRLAGDENSGEPGGGCATCHGKRVVPKWITHASEPTKPGDRGREMVPCPDCAARAPGVGTTDAEARAEYHQWQRESEAPTVYSSAPRPAGEVGDATP